MTLSNEAKVIVPPLTVELDAATAALVRLSARITAGSEEEIRAGFAECAAAKVSQKWQEELVLQSYLFAGFPRALNAAREWRKAGGSSADVGAEGFSHSGAAEWRTRGEVTCEKVYGEFYDKLRGNIRALSPALDEWMIVEGYGKVLSRGGLDLGRRELCVVAACAAAEQDRQLHSHLHGALNVGVPADIVRAALTALEGVVGVDALTRARLLFARIVGKRGS